MANTIVEILGSKEACTEVINGLEAIKKALAVCKSIKELHTIMVAYNSIDFRKLEVQNYINKDEHQNKRETLINLLADIERLTSGIQLLYGAQKLELGSLANGAKLLRQGLHPINHPPINDSAPKGTSAKPLNGPKQGEAEASKNAPPATPAPAQSTVLAKPVPPPIPARTGSSARPPSKSNEKPAAEASALPEAKPTGKSSAVPPPPPLKGKDEVIKKLREKHLIEFTKCLKQLQTKRDLFHKEFPTHAKDDTSNAYGSITQLIQNLEAAADKYRNNLSTLEEFKSDSSEMIKKERNGVLSQHRGYKEIIFNLLLAIATIGFTYAYGALFNQGKHLIKVNTDSVNKLDGALEAIEEVGMSV